MTYKSIFRKQKPKKAKPVNRQKNFKGENIGNQSNYYGFDKWPETELKPGQYYVYLMSRINNETIN